MSLHSSLLLLITCCGFCKTTPYHSLLSSYFIPGSCPLAPASPWVSSVWCQNSTQSGLQCKFDNICYDGVRKNLLAILGPSSVVSGVDSFLHLNEALFVSSVSGHSAFRASISVQLQNLFDYNEVILKDFIAFFMARFLPDNLHHVLHDDLLPLYFTLRQNCGDSLKCSKKSILFFLDGHANDQFTSLCKLFVDEVFTNEQPKFPSKLQCFKTSYAGLNKLSVWYQYGFGKPQGPVDHKFSGHLLRSFTNYVREKLQIKSSGSSGCNGVLLTRSLNRRILNEEQVRLAVEKVLKQQHSFESCNCHSVSLETHSLRQLISILSSAKIFLAMHGSGMILGMFLPPGAKLLELWPYGIDPNAASVYKCMARLPGMNLDYLSWTNEDFALSVVNEDFLPPGASSNVVRNLFGDTLTSVQCCKNSVWQAKIYQDTFVTIHSSDSSKSVGLYDLLLTELGRPTLLANWVGARGSGRLAGVVCHIHGNVLSVEWHPDSVGCGQYELVLMFNDSSDFLTEVVNYPFYQTQKTSLVKAHVWVSAICEGVVGAAAHTSCNNGT